MSHTFHHPLLTSLKLEPSQLEPTCDPPEPPRKTQQVVVSQRCLAKVGGGVSQRGGGVSHSKEYETPIIRDTIVLTCTTARHTTEAGKLVDVESL